MAKRLLAAVHGPRDIVAEALDGRLEQAALGWVVLDDEYATRADAKLATVTGIPPEPIPPRAVHCASPGGGPLGRNCAAER